jgi:subtilisin family serine protease
MRIPFIKSVVHAAPIVLLVTSAAAQEPTFRSQGEPEIVPGEFIIKVVPGFDETAMPAGILDDTFSIIDTLPLVGAMVVKTGQEGIAADALIQRLESLPGIAYVEPVYVVRADATPNDTSYGDQWAWPRISAPAAWDKQTDGSDIVVAVIDTGIDYRHPDLAANMWRNPAETPDNNVDDDGNGIVDDVFGANFFPSTATGDPFDDNRHGTHVAGTIGAVTDNNLGVAGVNWNAQIMAVKFLGGDGSGSTAGAIRAIEYAIRMDADIMNNSWGGGGFSRALEDAIKLANDEGILFIAAAGNGGSDGVGDNNDGQPHYPSNYDVPNVVSVMATDQNDNPAGFSNFGKTTVDLAAPGVSILSTTPGGNYAGFNGTSMATPHVAGAAALLAANDSTLTHLELKQRLMDSVDKVPALADLNASGGRLQLAALLGKAPPADEGCTAEAHTQIAYQEFFWSDQLRVSQNSNILSVEFDLPERMVVDIAAHGSGRRIAGSGNTTVRTGVFSQASPNTMWTGSYRRANFASANDNRILSSDFSVVLPAGKHTIYWKLWVSSATLQLDSGTLTVRGIPCSMGGKLALTIAAAKADVTEADPSTRAPE